MTNWGSEYIERNVHKHKVYIQGNCSLVQKSDLLSQLCNTCWAWGFFSFILTSAALRTQCEKIYLGATYFFVY